MKTSTLLTLSLVAMLATPMVAREPGNKRFANLPKSVITKNAPQMFISNNPSVKAAFLKLWSESPEVRRDMEDIYTISPMCPVTIFTVTKDTKNLPSLFLDDDQKGGQFYLSLESVQHEGKSLTLVVAAIIHTYHDAFYTNQGNSRAYLQSACPTMLSNAGDVVHFSTSAKKFAAQVQQRLSILDNRDIEVLTSYSAGR